jgi:hypothetical protein
MSRERQGDAPDERPGSERQPEAPNPEDDDVRREDEESEQSFPASDPPANY